MMKYIHTPHKTTGPYTELELAQMLRAFPARPGWQILDELEYEMEKALEKLG